MFPVFPTWPQTVYNDEKHSGSQGTGTRDRPPSTCPRRSQPPGQTPMSEKSGKSRQAGVNKERWRLGSWEAHSLRNNLSLAPANHCCVGMQLGLLRLQEQNFRFLHKIYFYSWKLIVPSTYCMGPNKIYPCWNLVHGPPF